MKILVFDTETTGKALNFKAAPTVQGNWPRIVQLAWTLVELKEDNTHTVLETGNFIVDPDMEIPAEATAVHGISTELAKSVGKTTVEVLEIFSQTLQKADILMAHNIDFDLKVVASELIRVLKAPADHHKWSSWFPEKHVCTMQTTTEYVGIKNYYGFKWPKLIELYEKVFGESFDGAHDALVDVTACLKCFIELKKQGVISI